MFSLSEEWVFCADKHAVTHARAFTYYRLRNLETIMISQSPLRTMNDLTARWNSGI